MTHSPKDHNDAGAADDAAERKNPPHSRRRRRRKLLRLALVLTVFLVLASVAGLWLTNRAGVIKENLEAATQVLPRFQAELIQGKSEDARRTLDQLRVNTAEARSASADPLWRAAALLPVAGANFSAVTEVAASADDVVNGVAAPILDDVGVTNWESLTPRNGRINVKPLLDASPSLSGAADTARLTHERLAAIDRSKLLREISGPLEQATDSLGQASDALQTAARTAAVLPSMLGSDGPRHYLILIQNNAELRATGGIPGSLAVLRADKGALSLVAQDSAAGLKEFRPPLKVNATQERIYTRRLGSYMQDVNLTPDFPTAANTARQMWEKRHKTRIDGVIALDPVVLSHVLEKTGPVQLGDDAASAAPGLPNQLTGRNVVKTLLSDVYAEIGNPQDHDVYFAAVAESVFETVTSGKGSTKALIEALGRSAEERRVFIWSRHAKEQNVFAATTLSGTVSGPNSGAFGVYFNDGTGAKMDYYVKRSVQLVRQCSEKGYSQASVRVTLTNTAPANADDALPRYVTGGGVFGVKPGNVQTNVVTYGPSQAQLEGASVNNKQKPVGSFFHGQRPVGVLTVELAPGESASLDFHFSNAHPTGNAEMLVTPTVQEPSDVLRAETRTDQCRSFQ